MIENVLHRLGGIEHYGIVSLSLFFACFTGMLVWVFLLKKPFLNEMSQLPLEPDSEDQTEGTQSHD